jgi:mRNA interferase MazF
VLIVQADPFNRSRISTVLAAVVSSNLRLADAPGNLYLSRSHTGLPKDSVVNISQIVTLDKRFLTGKAGEVTADHMCTVDDGLRLVLSL